MSEGSVSVSIYSRENIYLINYKVTIINENEIISFTFYQGLNIRLAFAIAAGAIGSGFQHGWATGVVNCPEYFVQTWIRGCNATWGDPVASTPAVTDGTNTTDANDGAKDLYIPTAEEYKECQMTKTEVTAVWSLVVAIFCVGGMIGGTSVGLISSKLGR